jgi:predicted nucleotidyltransferase
MFQNKNNLDMEILLVLIKDKTHLREIARLIKESPSTVLRKLNELIKENILDFKIEGKNKVFFIKNNLQAKNYVYGAERYKLNKLIKKYSPLSVILDSVINNSESSLVILFGSYSKFIAKKDSDIDIYLETENKKEKDEVECINSSINVKVGKFDVNSLLIKEIIKNHVILKGVEEFYERIKFFE